MENLMSQLNVAILCGSFQRPSRTLVLCQAVLAELRRHRPDLNVHVVEIAQIGRALGACFQRSELPPEILADVLAVEKADLVIAASPVYRATYTGHFKHFVDMLGMDALAGKPVLLGATGGSPFHALMLDHQLRPLFAMMQAAIAPVGVYAIEAHFSPDYRIINPIIQQRIALAVQMALPLLPQLDLAEA